jgi:hypothetical protein
MKDGSVRSVLRYEPRFRDVHCVKRWMQVLAIFWFLRPRLQASASSPYLRPTNISVTSFKSKTAVRNGRMKRILLKCGIHLVTCIVYVSCISSHFFFTYWADSKSVRRKRQKERRKKPKTLLGPQPNSKLAIQNFFSNALDISSLTETCIINEIYIFVYSVPPYILL